MEDTRRRTPRSELAAITENEDLLSDVIDTFADYRLLSLDHDPATRTPTVEVAHEAILREWERLRNWLNESRADVRLQRQLANMAEEWRGSKQDKSFLLRGSRLEMFEGWMAETGLAVTPGEREFLKASTVEHRREEAEKRVQEERESRLERRARQVLQGLVAVFSDRGGGGERSGSVGEFTANRAEDEKQHAQTAEQEALRQASIGLAAVAEKELEGTNPERGVLLALEALEYYPVHPAGAGSVSTQCRRLSRFAPF